MSRVSDRRSVGMGIGHIYGTAGGDWRFPLTRGSTPPFDPTQVDLYMYRYNINYSKPVNRVAKEFLREAQSRALTRCQGLVSFT